MVHSYATLASIYKCQFLCLCSFLRFSFISPTNTTIRTPAKHPFCINILFARCGPIILIPNAIINAIPESVVQFTFLSTRSINLFFSVSSWTCSCYLYFSACIQFHYLTTGGSGSSYLRQIYLTLFGKIFMIPFVEMIYLAFGWIFSNEFFNSYGWGFARTGRIKAPIILEIVGK